MLRTTRRMLLLFVLVVLSPPPLLAQTVHSRFATVNGVRLHYLEAGTGSPIILLHGFGETGHIGLAPLSNRVTTGRGTPRFAVKNVSLHPTRAFRIAWLHLEIEATRTAYIWTT